MSEPVAVRAPVENVNDETIAILQWLVENGDRVEKDTPLLLAETTKTSFDIPSPVAGFVWKVAPDTGEVPTSALLCYVGDDLATVKQAAIGEQTGGRAMDSLAAGPQAGAGETQSGPGTSRMSKKALALIKSLGMDPGEFAGTGLVREQDVLDRARAGQQTPTDKEGVQVAIEPLAPPGGGAAGVASRAEKLPRSKRLEAQFLRAALAGTIPSMATVAVPTSGFFAKANSRPDLAGYASTAVIFEASRLLRAYPVFNAFHEAGAVHYYEDVNVGYAFDLGQGLKVPVIRRADQKSFPDISAEKQQRLVEYISNSLPVEALTGGTFTITDLSGEGVVHFNPVLNQGQSAILGICAEVLLDGADQGTFNLVLGFDHQLSEGRTAAGFLRDLRDRLIAHEQSLGPAAADDPNEPQCSHCGRSVSEIQANNQFLIRTIVNQTAAEKAVCSICVQGW